MWSRPHRRSEKVESSLLGSNCPDLSCPPRSSTFLHRIGGTCRLESGGESLSRPLRLDQSYRRAYALELLSSASCKRTDNVRNSQDQGLGIGAIRIDFIGRVPTDHVFDRLFTARVKFEESIHLENRVLVDYNMFSFRDQALDVPAA